ncbi:TPA: hypothetical protein DF272_03590 [Candidatus Falkowbacteria bacterium]|nr:hypothetical protein [Candidatus Falkowbacteria bacterium]
MSNKDTAGGFFRVTDDFWANLLLREMKFHAGDNGFDVAEIFIDRDRRLVLMVPRLPSDITKLNLMEVERLIAEPDDFEEMDDMPFSLSVIRSAGLVYFIKFNVGEINVSVLMPVPYSLYSQDFDGYVGFVKVNNVTWTDAKNLDLDSSKFSVVYRDYVSGFMEICLAVGRDEQNKPIPVLPSVTMSTDGRKFIRV